MAHGQITHVEFPADDTARARRFYGELFGWEFGEMEGFAGYYMFSFGAISAAGGAIGEPKAEISGQGWFAVINDSEGSEVGLFEGLPER